MIGYCKLLLIHDTYFNCIYNTFKTFQQTIPPVRTKKKKAETICTEESTDEKPSKTQRIKGGDYKSWEKFDAVSFLI